jgi:hypothetical protein
MIAAPYHTAWKLCAKLRRAMVKHRGREDAAGRVCRGCGRKGRTASRARGQAIRTPLFCRSVVQFTGHGWRRAYLSLRSESLEGSRKMSDQERWLNEVLDILGLPRDTAYRDYARELVERGASLEQIYGTLQMRMNSKRS